MTKKKQHKYSNEELVEHLQRLQAEFENFKRRTEKDAQQFRSFANTDIISKLLPVIDNFERALDHAPSDEFAKGVRMVFDQLMSLLTEEGLEIINPKGLEFDPKYHEALMVEESKDKSGRIIEVFEKGYKFNGQLMRAAKVKVAK